jgi:hypothetical protein
LPVFQRHFPFLSLDQPGEWKIFFMLHISYTLIASIKNVDFERPENRSKD